MMSLGVYHHHALYENLLEQDDFQIVNIDNLTNLKNICTFDLFVVNLSDTEPKNYMPFVNKMQGLIRPKIIYLKDKFSFQEVKRLMFSGAYDCQELPIDTIRLLTILQKASFNLKKEIRKRKTDKAYALRSIRESLAYDLLYGNTRNAKEIWERSQLAHLSLIPNTVLLLSIDHFSRLVKNKGEKWKMTVREEILQAIRECDLQYESLKVLVTQEKYAILLALPVQIEEGNYKILATEYAGKIRRKINEKTAYTVTIGIGNYYEDARNLHLSYQESEQAQAHRLFSRENAIIHIGDLDLFETPEYYQYKIQIQEMNEKFSIGDIDAVCKKWEGIYHSVETQARMQPEEFRLQVLDLLFSLTKSAIKNGANPKNMMPLQIKHAKELHALETLAEIDTWMKEIIKEYNQLVYEGHNEMILKSVQEVLRYVEEHFHEDLGLKKVAEQVDLSPNYVSAIFKQTTGSSFTDYLTDRRMKEAKEFLKDFKKTIYEIAESVGYSSSQYFSRVFKNHVGMTPTAYRNSLLSTNKW